ncbi:TMEM165/GDT1 family protein [Ilumatobacter sp.]|jgi:putative Ca2+/H+ antiporter (TMEM165/GDT1 family)|uniref:TMEM165/GDT1 family protein n=1 Tax=Ilumatobacter sp. TaxID=1967498 RepID=UPI0037534B72
MYDLLTAVVAAFGIVFLAELGDKTQLLAVNFGSRYSLRQVIVGLALGYGTASLVAVTVGGLLGASLPQRPIEIAGGLIFIVFGLVALRSDNGDGGDDTERRSMVRSSVVATIALAIFVAEMGDKTQIATATLAARSNLIGTWIGSTAGEVASGMIGVLAGSMVGDRIPATVMKWVSALLFVAFGIAMLAGWP